MSKKILISVILGGIALIIAVFFISTKFNFFDKTEPEPVSMPPQDTGPEFVKKQILTEHPNTFPQILSSSELADLPPNLSFFRAESGETKIEQITYDSGKTGYKITIRNDWPIQSAENAYIQKIIKQAGWKIDYGAYNEIFALIDADSDDYSSHIEINKISDNLTDINVQVISK